VKNKKHKIFVGVSGGVDSSVVAYLLKQQGHEVHGVFVKTWSPDWLPCTWVDEKRDAMRVCAALDIPFHFLDAEEAYKQGVADYMIAEYKAGRTPNPDVLCNRVIKFGALWDYVQSQGGQYIATGHYAQTDGMHLMKGADPAKDQSYFLWMLSPRELSHILFPIGHLQKSEVRILAEKARLFTSEKKDSQGICFLGDIDMKEFLSHYIEQKTGAVIDTNGNTIGRHDGIWFYTLGERHGFRIAKQSTDQKPYYVVEKRIEDNTLVVSHEKEVFYTKKETQIITLRNTSFLEDIHKTLEAQIRYHGELIPAKMIDQNTVKLSYKGVIAEGQSLVLYKKNTLVGGGVIDSIS
jgi:tRNA-uridine 2-sulfurtransferase